MPNDSKIPNNPEAETVVRLQTINSDIDSQILTLAKTQASNEIIIENLMPNAKWVTIEELTNAQIETGEK